MVKFFFRLLLLCLVMACGVSSAWAQVVLKPNGRNAIPLRTKSMQADVTIDRQVATTHLTLTFQNETSERIEADFIYTMPTDSLVTSFAYWYGTEKVIAKVVEKEEAAAIYKHITTRMRDPALVEMIGRNTFRARIFPVMPNSDLKVEMNLARALPSDSKGALYTFPLKTQKGDALDSVDVRVHVKADAAISGIANSLGLPITHDGAGYRIALHGTNYRPQKDLGISLLRKPHPLHAELYAAPSTNRRDGFFALSVTPDRDLTNPKISIAGVQTYETAPALPTSVKAHHALTFFGRYKGSGKGQVTLSGQSAKGPFAFSQPVIFYATNVGNNAASKLWAARRMEQLSANDANRETVIALSKRYGMPGKYTSWLAVPKEEMKRYEKEIAAAKIAVVARQLAGEIADNRGSGAKANQLRAQYDHWRKIVGANPEWAVSYSLSHDIENVVTRLVGKIEKDQYSTRDSRMLSAQLQLLCKVVGGNNPQQNLQEYLYQPLTDLAQKIVDARHADTPNLRRIAAMTRQYHHLKQYGGRGQQDYLTTAENGWRGQKIDTLSAELYAERQKDNPNARKVRELEESLVNVYAPSDRDYARMHAEITKLAADENKINNKIASLPQTNSARLTQLKQQQKALQERRADLLPRLNHPPEYEVRARMGDPLISIDAPEDAVQVIAIMPGGEIKRLVYDGTSKHWEVRFDIPTYASEGAYIIKIIVVLKDGTRKILTMRYHVDLTPPTGTARAQVIPADIPATHPTLRLELDGGTDMARVKALLPNGEMVDLKPAAQPGRFFALVALPPGQAHPGVVTYILTDRAHNRTTITINMEK